MHQDLNGRCPIKSAGTDHGRITQSRFASPVMSLLYATTTTRLRRFADVVPPPLCRRARRSPLSSHHRRRTPLQPHLQTPSRQHELGLHKKTVGELDAFVVWWARPLGYGPPHADNGPRTRHAISRCLLPRDSRGAPVPRPWRRGCSRFQY